MVPLAPIGSGPGALSPLLSPLALDQQVFVSADARHAAAVAGALPTGPSAAAPKATITSVDEVDGTQLVAPAEMLLELAESSTPVLLPGLRDLSLRWAWLRYCWAFAQPPAPPAIGRLLLSHPARTLAQHHKQVTSDQLGVGFGLVFARRALEARFNPASTSVHDAEEVIDGAGLGNWGLRRGGGLRPDYLIRVRSAAAGRIWNSVWVLECKGTHGSGHLNQLRKGVTQAASLVDAATGAQASSIVSATIFSKTQTRVRLVDPPSEHADPWTGVEGEVVARQASLDRLNDRINVSDTTAFREELAALDVARTLAFAGLYAQASRALPERLREVASDDEPQRDGTLETARRPLKAFGTQARLPLLRGEHLGALCAVDDRVLSAARDGDRVALAQAREQIREERVDLADGPFRRAVIHVDSPSRVRVESSAGLVLELDVA